MAELTTLLVATGATAAQARAILAALPSASASFTRPLQALQAALAA